MYRIEFLASAARELGKLERTVQRRVGRRINQLAEDPRGPEVVKLRGAEDVWRARVGDYRVLYRIEGDRVVVLIIRIAHRGEVYR